MVLIGKNLKAILQKVTYAIKLKIFLLPMGR